MPGTDASHDAKRRKLRKGTTSCWECKRRKVKCEYEEDHEKPPCRPCVQRGLNCVSQELPEPPPYLNYVNAAPATGELRQINSQTPATPKSGTHLQSGPSSSALQGLSGSLIEALPSRDDLVKILNASDNPSVLAHAINIVPCSALSQDRSTTRETLLEVPNPDTHPVLIAKHMLLLASFIQQLHPRFLKEIPGLSESPLTLMRRLVGLASSLVTTNDDLLGTIESIECLMIEGLYQMNTGNLRKAWITVRRALNIAQLMKLNRPSIHWKYRLIDDRTRYDPQHMWLKIVFLDRYLCLMLGLPQGCADYSMASDAVLPNETPMGRLERIHCVVAGRILERNDSYPHNEDEKITRTLDKQLQKAARDLPSKWWLIPTLHTTPSNPEASFWNVRQLFAQILHYDLLNQLHLPYMLCGASSTDRRDYSRIACVNASREMLLRWMTLRKFNSAACSCRSVDFVALMAAVTLLLAHLGGRRAENNMLAHQYQSDRAMIEQVQECMEESDHSNSDTLSAKSANLLRRLLAIDGEAADGDATDLNVGAEATETTLGDDGNDSIVKVHIPYFGTIKIAHDGITRVPPSNSKSGGARSLEASSTRRPSQIQTTLNATEQPGLTQSGVGSSNQSQPAMLQTPNTVVSQELSAPDSFDDLNGSDLQTNTFPSLAAGLDDWAFQGVDQAFFESLMGSDENGSGGAVDWGYDHYVAEKLRLPSSAERTLLHGVGCSGGGPGHENSMEQVQYLQNNDSDTETMREQNGLLLGRIMEMKTQYPGWMVVLIRKEGGSASATLVSDLPRLLAIGVKVALGFNLVLSTRLLTIHICLSLSRQHTNVHNQIKINIKEQSRFILVSPYLVSTEDAQHKLGTSISDGAETGLSQR
ncbi:hypothetical protein PRZ48_003345 [Zasmidium cellare]|uniref:Zn(2)-C6 fungal-type domain-containing protein n=1 Tax=Zasmidium cellare TaxID=395010 RepID=A0ABR0EUS9_ZASCE|nr:hypothetical protein PRZ48_003345 [Zasmidium cellare]